MNKDHRKLLNALRLRDGFVEICVRVQSDGNHTWMDYSDHIDGYIVHIPSESGATVPISIGDLRTRHNHIHAMMDWVASNIRENFKHTLGENNDSN